ncbi:MAG: hypothetical protein IJD76_06160 [Bacilli bacterium]|nr:hypothetical protein [Bacilli bacterium]
MKNNKRHVLTLISSIFQLFSALAFLALTIYFLILFLSVALNKTPAADLGEGITRVIIIILSVILIPVFIIFFIKNLVLGLLQLKNSAKPTLGKGIMITQCVVSGIFTLILIVLLLLSIFTEDPQIALIIINVCLLVFEIVAVTLSVVDYNKEKKNNLNE